VTLGGFLFIWFAGRLRWRRRAAAKFGNRSQQLSPVPNETPIFSRSASVK
jgi:hypothetical protein